MPGRASGPRQGFQNRFAQGNIKFDWKNYLQIRFPPESKMRVMKAAADIEKDLKNMLLERASYYAGEMLREFIMWQRVYPTDERAKFWTNRTHLAAMSWFTGAYESDNFIRMFAAHGNEVYYAVYLEYGMDRRFESLRPLVLKYGDRLFRNVKARLDKGKW